MISSLLRLKHKLKNTWSWDELKTENQILAFSFSPSKPLKITAFCMCFNIYICINPDGKKDNIKKSIKFHDVQSRQANANRFKR